MKGNVDGQNFAQLKHHELHCLGQVMLPDTIGSLSVAAGSTFL